MLLVFLLHSSSLPQASALNIELVMGNIVWDQLSCQHIYNFLFLYEQRRNKNQKNIQTRWPTPRIQSFPVYMGASITCVSGERGVVFGCSQGLRPARTPTELIESFRSHDSWVEPLLCCHPLTDSFHHEEKHFDIDGAEDKQCENAS